MDNSIAVKIVQLIKVLVGPYPVKMNDGEEAVKAYFMAIENLDFLSVQLVEATVERFHRGEFVFLNPDFCPKPHHLRKMIEETRAKIEHKALVQAFPEQSRKRYLERTKDERFAAIQFRAKLKEVGLFNPHLIDVESIWATINQKKTKGT